MFFIDFDGHKDNKQISKILQQNKKHIKLLGSYVKEEI
jgi:chorismate mutase/prephenate dehydratase